MIFTYEKKEWVILNPTERQLFARLLIEVLFWNHWADEDWSDKYAENNHTRETGVEVFDKFSTQVRDVFLWHCLKCVCYEEVDGDHAAIEATLRAIPTIIYWEILQECEASKDLLEEEREDYAGICFTSYRVLLETVYRHLHHQQNKRCICLGDYPLNPVTAQKLLRSVEIDFTEYDEVDAIQKLLAMPAREIWNPENTRQIIGLFGDLELEYPERFQSLELYQQIYREHFPLHPPNPQEMLQRDSQSFWFDRLAAVSDYFGSGDYEHEAVDYQRDPRRKEYFSTMTLLKKLEPELLYGYWDLLFACLWGKPIPPVENLTKSKYHSNWFATIEQTLSPEQLLWLRNNLITTAWKIEV